MELTIKYNLDMSGLDTVYSACNELAKKVHAGVLNNPNAAMKAARNELGMPTDEGYFVPARSTIRNSIENVDVFSRGAEKLKDFTPETARAAINEVGDSAVKAIEDSFSNKGYGTWADNAPWTIRVKGRNEPMVDTGELRDSISYEVVG